MKGVRRTAEIMTPEQAAEYLQVNRETVYRYIRQGKLVASRLGRAYRISKRSVDLLLWATRTRSDITLREYTTEEIEQFVRDDALSPKAQQIARDFSRVMEGSSAPTSSKETQADRRT